MIFINEDAQLKRKKLAVLISAMIAGHAASPSLAQETQNANDALDEEIEEITVTGIRGALQTARDIKRDADTFVDSITSSDVSALPDLSVAEALQRVPGVTVTRVELGGSAGDFPSPEGSGNLIRGLGFVRSEFNGRDAFSANGGRALDWSSVPPELVGGVDVYKNQSADLIEGGISGSINLRTLEPFDRDGTIAVFTAEGTYTDLRGETTPQGSAILGDRWELDSGAEVGLIGSASYSELKSDLNGFQVGHLAAQTLDDGRTIAIPSGAQVRTNEVDRERQSAYLAGQFRSADGSFEATMKYARVQNDITQFERTTENFAQADSIGSLSTVGDFQISPFASAGLPLCQGDNEAVAGECEALNPVNDGLFESGVITNTQRAWFGAAGAPLTNLAIAKAEESKTEDLSVNLKWNATDQLFLSFDAHYTKADSEFMQLWGVTRTFAELSLRPDLENPAFGLNINPSHTIGDGQIQGGGFQTPTSLADPAASFLLASNDSFRQGEGDLYAVRVDADYAFEDAGWFESVKFGARFSEREQINRDSGESWSGVAPPWNGGYAPFSALPEGTAEAVDFGDFFRGGVISGDTDQLLFVNQELLQDYDRYTSLITNDPAFANADWRPQRVDGVVDYGADGVSDVREEVQNLYVRLDFGNEFENGRSLQGNVGLRYVRADVESAGFRTYAEFGQDLDQSALPIDDPNYRTPEEEARDDIRDFVPEAAAFYDQLGQDLTLDQSDDYLLPSVNLKYNLNDDMLIRFGASKAITRPNIQDIRAAQVFTQQNVIVLDETAAVGEDREILGVILSEQRIFGGNPNLKPTEAVNVDLSFEYYFGDSNSFTASIFQKDLKNTIIYSEENRGTITLDGQEVNSTFNGLINQDNTEIRGVEFAYQQFYDNLPGWMSNLGLQLNYTYIDAETTRQPDFNQANAVEGDTRGFRDNFRFGVENLIGQSEHTGNIVGIYQSDKTEFRLAYNYRSEYLSSYRDYVSGNPIFQEGVGFLDASFRYDFTDNLQFRISAANLLDTKSKAVQQVDQAGQRYARTSFLNDRRVVFGLRYQY